MSVTRAEVLSWPPEAITAARVVGDPVGEPDDQSGYPECAWGWIRMDDAHLTDCFYDGAYVEVRSLTRTGGDWVKVEA